jgi:hypothetical protein
MIAPAAADAAGAPEGEQESQPMSEPTRSETERPGGTAPPAAQGAPPPLATQAVECDDADATALYYNFVRVSGTPEEVILDFGLNPKPLGMPEKPIKVAQKLVANYYTAKRLLLALQMTIQRHEATFGVLEIDVNKRVRQPPGGMR